MIAEETTLFQLSLFPSSHIKFLDIIFWDIFYKYICPFYLKSQMDANKFEDAVG